MDSRQRAKPKDNLRRRTEEKYWQRQRHLMSRAEAPRDADQAWCRALRGPWHWSRRSNLQRRLKAWFDRISAGGRHEGVALQERQAGLLIQL